MERLTALALTGLVVLMIVAAPLALFSPVDATTTTSTADYAWEFYSNDDLKGTTSVALTRKAVSVLIHNVGTTGDLLLVAAGETSPSTGAHVTIPPGAALTLEPASGVSVISALQFWSSATCSVEILAERYR